MSKVTGKSELLAEGRLPASAELLVARPARRHRRGEAAWRPSRKRTHGRTAGVRYLLAAAGVRMPPSMSSNWSPRAGGIAAIAGDEEMSVRWAGTGRAGRARESVAAHLDPGELPGHVIEPGCKMESLRHRLRDRHLGWSQSSRGELARPARSACLPGSTRRPGCTASPSVLNDESTFPLMTGSAFSPSHAADDVLPGRFSTSRMTDSSGPGMSTITSLALAARR